MNKFDIYDIEYISGSMSLREPQKKSLEILDNILNHVNPSKNIDLEEMLIEVKKLYPICTDFERDFMSLAFVLATGVGKTRLMGAFITYLYTKHNIKNFFIVAPGTTVFNKLKQDFGNPDSDKYVFKGIGCFTEPPRIISDDDYRTKNSLFSSDIKIFIFNIDKFNSEKTKMRQKNEILGDSFIKYLSNIDDLVLIMDESHHYHADKGFESLNDLKPILGLELTATPYYNNGRKQVPFKNAVYEYPLSESIKDGYTRTPFALTQQNIDFYNFGDEELDRIMILDGLKNHENIKRELEKYSTNNNVKRVKPFVMIVCKDTEHAEKIAEFVKSDQCNHSRYKNKTIIIHTNQKKAVKEANIELLLEVEKYDNPIEIVIHVDKLKEGWDVNNLYTIIPLRTASSKILREQMVGRGLRLPFGKRTGEKYIDAVMLTAHGKFEDILEEARKGDSIFNAGNVIYTEEIENVKQENTQISLNIELSEVEITNELENYGIPLSKENKDFVKKTTEVIKKKTSEYLFEIGNKRKDVINEVKVKHEVIRTVKEDEKLSKIFKDNEDSLIIWLDSTMERTIKETMGNFIPIPLIKIVDSGIEEYKIIDFDLDFSNIQYFPTEQNIILQNLENLNEREILRNDSFVSYDINPVKEILSELRKKPEIDYEKSSDLMYKLIQQFLKYYTDKFDENGMKNIVMMNKVNIANEIYYQMIADEHFYYTSGLFIEKIIDVSKINKPMKYDYKYKNDLFNDFQGNIINNLFINIKKGVYDKTKFHSEPELNFARLLEYDSDVIRWLRPHKEEFNLFYNRNRRYEPDFVVETKEIIYLVEIKGEDRLNDADVIAKKERAIQYCKVSSEWARDNNYKEWRYLFIPSQAIKSSVSFNFLREKYVEV